MNLHEGLDKGNSQKKHVRLRIHGLTIFSVEGPAVE